MTYTKMLDALERKLQQAGVDPVGVETLVETIYHAERKGDHDIARRAWFNALQLLREGR